MSEPRSAHEAREIVVQAKMGTLVRENGDQLTSADAPYLVALELEVRKWLESVQGELHRFRSLEKQEKGSSSV